MLADQSDGNMLNEDSESPVEVQPILSLIRRCGDTRRKTKSSGSSSVTFDAKRVRMGLDGNDIHGYWFLANDALGFHKVHPRLFDHLNESSSLDNCGESGDVKWAWNILSKLQKASVIGVLRVVEREYLSISGYDFVPVLLEMLSVFFDQYEVFSIISCIEDRNKRPCRRPFFINSSRFSEWGVYQLCRYIKSPTEEQLDRFLDFVHFGGCHTLPFHIFVRVVGSFLFEGCKVFVRYGIAYLLNGMKADDSLTRRAFQLSISFRSYPLDSNKMKRISHIKIPPRDKQSIRDIQPMTASDICDLSTVIAAVIHCLAVPGSVHKVQLRYASYRDGMSLIRFLSGANDIFSKHVIFLFVINTDGPVLIFASSRVGSSVYAVAGTSVTLNSPVVLRSSKTLIESSGGDMLFIRSIDGEIILSLDESLNRISIPNFGTNDFPVINFEIFA